MVQSEGSLTSSSAPPTPPSQNHTVTDRDYLLAIISERDRLYAARFDAQERASQQNIHAQHDAVEKAAGAAEKRFDSVNEFRNQLKDQQQLFMTRAEYFASHKQIVDETSLLRAHQVPREEHENRWSNQEMHFREVTEKIDKIAERQFMIAGQREGQSGLWGVLAAVVAILISLAGVVVNLSHHL